MLLLRQLWQRLLGVDSCVSEICPSFFSTSYFLAPHVIHTHLIFSLPQPWIRSLPAGARVPFPGRWYLETQIWAQECLLVPRCCGSDPSPWTGPMPAHHHASCVYFSVCHLHAYLNTLEFVLTLPIQIQHSRFPRSLHPSPIVRTLALVILSVLST